MNTQLHACGSILDRRSFILFYLRYCTGTTVLYSTTRYVTFSVYSSSNSDVAVKMSRSPRLLLVPSLVIYCFTQNWKILVTCDWRNFYWSTIEKGAQQNIMSANCRPCLDSSRQKHQRVLNTLLSFYTSFLPFHWGKEKRKNSSFSLFKLEEHASRGTRWCR